MPRVSGKTQTQLAVANASNADAEAPASPFIATA